MTTVAERPVQTVGTGARTPLVEVIVGQDLTGTGLRRLVLLLDDALTLRPSRLVVDLAGSRTLDASALHVLLNAHTRMLRAGGQLALRSVGPAHERVVALAGLRGVFQVEGDDEQPAQGTGSR